MGDVFINRINNDLRESHINWKVGMIFVPIAFFTYLFHESGHWTFGQLLGNEMGLSLNNSAPVSGSFIKNSHALWSAIGGPVFTIMQALIFAAIVIKTKSVYAFSLVFFAFFSRFFSIVFGGIDLQDEARIASMLNVNKYLVSFLVLFVLVIILWRSSRTMKLDMKAIGYYTIFGTLAILVVIGTNEWIL